jgi:hypothetical protein
MDLNKVPKQEKLDARYPSSAHNERYLNTQEAGSMGDGIMGHASKVMFVDPAPDYDGHRLDALPYDYRGTPKEAFNYDF